jgi:adenylate kinase
VHLNAGDLLRDAIKERSGGVRRRATDSVASGQVVSDELLTEIVVERLRAEDCVSNGWALDGFPRTAPQTEALIRAGIMGDFCVQLEAAEALLVERAEGRRVDPVTGALYHMRYAPPPMEEEAVLNRLARSPGDSADSPLLSLY